MRETWNIETWVNCWVFFNDPQAAAIKKIIPMLDRILIQRAEALTKTKGGIVLPEKAVGKVLEGTVLAVGPGTVMPWVFRHYQCRDGHLITEHPTSSAVHWQPHSHWREGGRSCSAARIRWHQGEPRGWPEGAVPLPRVRHPGQIGVDLASGHCLTILWILCFLLVCNTPPNPKLKNYNKSSCNIFVCIAHGPPLNKFRVTC